MRKGIFTITLACVLLGVLAYDASADGRDPASCLLYPYFNTNAGHFAVITVTNICSEEVHLRIVFISDDNDCLPKDYWRTLTGYDTFTFLDYALNQKAMTGFLYIYVVEEYGSKAEKKMDCLIGQEFIFESWGPGGVGAVVNYGINAVSFAVGANTVNGDGKLMLDGNEYDPAPSAVRFPRFFGQDGNFNSMIYLINLTGGKYYEANIGFRIFDDSEHEFSDQIQIPCYFYDYIYNILPDVYETHLQGTSTDLDEVFDGTPPPPVGAPHKKTGWMEVFGINAHYFINQFENPGIYAYLVEMVGPGYAADLPWEVFGPVNNAMLWSTSPDGL